MSVIRILTLSLIFNIGLAQIRTVNNFRETSILRGQQAINADATVTLVDVEEIRSDNGKDYRYSRRDLKSWGYCPNQRYVDQPEPGFCSGVLVSENVILTAGHCIENASECASTKFVFDFENRMIQTPAGEIAVPPSTLSKDNVYSCSKILFRREEGLEDVALIQLDRNVMGRTPVRYRRSSAINESENMYLISSPHGMPKKNSEGKVTFSYDYDDGRRALSSDYASEPGSSGGPVFNSETNLLEGIHIGINTQALVLNKFSPSGCLLWSDVNHKIVSTTADGEEFIYYGRSNVNAVKNYIDQLDRYTSGPIPAQIDLPNENKLNTSEDGVE